MILPIVGYGHSVLRVPTKQIDKNYPYLQELIANMFETMYRASGVGLAAPQVNLPISLIVIDATPFVENYPEAEGFKCVVINPEILEKSDETWTFEEGCLSLPGIHENVVRPKTIKVRYLDENFNTVEKELSGVCARVFQHEFDHLQGKVFVDRISNLRKAFLKKKLSDIASSKVRGDYKMLK